MFRLRAAVTVVCIFFLSSAVLVPLAKADWPMYRANPERTGVGTGNIRTVPTLLWESNVTFPTGYLEYPPYWTKSN